MPGARLLLADPETLFVEALRSLLAPRFRVVGNVCDGQALLAAMARLRPQLVVCNPRLPGLDGLDVARRLAREVPFVLLSSSAAHAEDALRAGALGYVLKCCPCRELVAAIRSALAGRTYVTPLVPAGVQLPRLTTRQRAVLRLVASGCSAKEVSQTLKISPKTAQFHKSLLMRSLGIFTTAGLTRYAIDHGMAE